MLSVEEIVQALLSGNQLLRVRLLFVFRELAADAHATGPHGEGPLVFLPDLHLLSHERADGYGDYFNLNVGQEDVLRALLARLLSMRDDHRDRSFANLAVYQLGDLHDLWREEEHWWRHEDLGDMFDRQLKSHADVFELLGRLRAIRLAGNHDARLRHEQGREVFRWHPIGAHLPPERLVGDLDLLPWGPFSWVGVLHGDQIDKVETGPFHDLNPIGSRLASHGGLVDIGSVDAWRWELLPAGTRDSTTEPATLPMEVIAFEKPLADPKLDKEMRLRFFDDSRAYASKRAGALTGSSCAAIVIGHTHAPRIVVRSQGDANTLVDCGSWVNFGLDTRSKTTFWNGQIGVLTGSQVALLQIDL